jgi:hypothetical protein
MLTSSTDDGFFNFDANYFTTAATSNNEKDNHDTVFQMDDAIPYGPPPPLSSSSSSLLVPSSHEEVVVAVPQLPLTVKTFTRRLPPPVRQSPQPKTKTHWSLEARSRLLELTREWCDENNMSHIDYLSKDLITGVTTKFNRRRKDSVSEDAIASRLQSIWKNYINGYNLHSELVELCDKLQLFISACSKKRKRDAYILPRYVTRSNSMSIEEYEKDEILSDDDKDIIEEASTSDPEQMSDLINPPPPPTKMACPLPNLIIPHENNSIPTLSHHSANTMMETTCLPTAIQGATPTVSLPKIHSLPPPSLPLSPTPTPTPPPPPQQQLLLLQDQKTPSSSTSVPVIMRLQKIWRYCIYLKAEIETADTEDEKALLKQQYNEWREKHVRLASLLCQILAGTGVDVVTHYD